MGDAMTVDLDEVRRVVTHVPEIVSISLAGTSLEGEWFALRKEDLATILRSRTLLAEACGMEDELAHGGFPEETSKSPGLAVGDGEGHQDTPGTSSV